MTNRITRLAPSPTGALHLGNARTFLVNWAMARQQGWSIRMRIEDLDGPRNKPDSGGQILDILNWLGIDHDWPVLYQSHNLDPYRRAMAALAEQRLTYSCTLTRSQIEAAASAPHEDDEYEPPDGPGREVRYCSSLRPEDPAAYAFSAEDTNYRLIVPDDAIVVDDCVAGRAMYRPARGVGDFVIWTRRACPAYQLAVVVDDARQGVTDVVRGQDLLPSAARQLLLYRALGLPEPRWWHLPLIVGPDGRRLAKRHGDTRVAFYREAGVAPQRVIGLLAAWSGIGPADELTEMSAADFRDRFTLARLPRNEIVFSEDHHQWLLHT